MRYADRTEAGVSLTETLRTRMYAQPLILALPRGGVPVAYEVAVRLHAPLDTLVVRKVGAPLNPEFAVGALAPFDISIFDDESIRSAGSSRAAVEGVVSAQKRELERRTVAYRSGSYAAGFIPETVILVDDGIATGLSARAASAAARKKYPRARIVFAAPVCLGGVDASSVAADELVCLSTGESMYAISQAYGSFPQVGDAEVESLLRSAREQFAR